MGLCEMNPIVLKVRGKSEEFDPAGSTRKAGDRGNAGMPSR